MKDIPAGVFRELLDSAKLRPREVRDRLAKALAPDYWRNLAGTDREPLPDRTADRAQIAAAVDDFRREGVYRVGGAIGGPTIARINATIDAVLGDGWPAVFAFACDELWECARLGAIRMLVEGGLGVGARQIPHIWTHIVKPRAESAGWSPHVDGTGAHRMTVWLALSGAGLDNGCMYAVPRAAAVEKSVEQWRERDILDKANVKTLLQGTRAMPASTGDLLGWAFDIMHWGGPVARHAPGRRSLSFEYIGADALPGPTEEPLVPLTGALPPHAERLRAIAAALLEYGKFEPLVLRYQDLAKQLVAALS